jgi:hypothetical protein
MYSMGLFNMADEEVICKYKNTAHPILPPRGREKHEINQKMMLYILQLQYNMYAQQHKEDK